MVGRTDDCEDALLAGKVCFLTSGSWHFPGESRYLSCAARVQFSDKEAEYRVDIAGRFGLARDVRHDGTGDACRRTSGIGREQPVDIASQIANNC
jgi:hypothetical protein